ncbi:ribokinase [Pleomorphomonas diazotrophica]|uniref:Ribokinase n=1 Tax=Pleomorphomonas diazotrophica TaxID=1166257 RepID=A0A1I4U068_9HYPH|nr:PfkB family carbohydrate kinase [Pleomorphomonas diazotrophica]PKR87806.1 ribokinase [Pleomorphomonas diazotrophica]SFM82230.1 ribokinase [Pleomorphomonas diazotrophica]
MALHVVGNVCVDDTFYVERLPRPGETVNAVATARGVGGKGANQAVAASRIGAEVVFRAALGDDADAMFLRAALGAELPLDGLVMLDTPTDRSTILVNREGENVVVTAAASATAFDPTGQLSWPGLGDHLLMQGNLRADVTRVCLEKAKDGGAITILNPSPLDGGPVPEADVIIVNAGEAEAMAGCADPAEAARRLSRGGTASVVVTLGADGAICLDRGAKDVERIAAPAVAAVDSSGAGDVFAGVLSGCLTRGVPLSIATTVGVRAASIAVTRRGTLAACPSRTEINALITGISRDLS